jgi:hypothetical protein
VPNIFTRILGSINGVLTPLFLRATDVIHSDGKSVEEHINEGGGSSQALLFAHCYDLSNEDELRGWFTNNPAAKAGDLILFNGNYSGSATNNQGSRISINPGDIVRITEISCELLYVKVQPVSSTFGSYNGIHGNRIIGGAMSSRGLGVTVVGDTAGAFGDDATVVGATSWALQGGVALGKRKSVSHQSAGIVSPAIPFQWQNSNAANRLILGDDGINVAAYGGVADICDARDKTNIKPLSVNLLEFICKLKPVEFKYDLRQRYSYFQEISKEDCDALNEYEKRHNVAELPVYAIKADGEVQPFEWLSGFAKIGAHSSHDSPNCFEKRVKAVCGENVRFDKLTIGDIPVFTTVNEDAYGEHSPVREINAPQFINTYFHSQVEAVAAFDLEQHGATNTNVFALSASAKKLSFCPENPAIKEREEQVVVCGTERVRVRTAYFHRRQRTPDGTLAGRRTHIDFLAQDVKTVADEMGFDFTGLQNLAFNTDENGVPLGDDVLALVHTKFVPIMVAAIKTLRDEKDSQIAELRHRLEILEGGTK